MGLFIQVGVVEATVNIKLLLILVWIISMIDPQHLQSIPGRFVGLNGAGINCKT